MLNFRDKTIKEIRLWAWAAAVLPITSLAALFFVWLYGTDHWVDILMIAGSTAMFVIAVVWWWWVLYVFRRLLDLWASTNQDLIQVLTDVKELRKMIRKVISEKSDK